MTKANGGIYVSTGWVIKLKNYLTSVFRRTDYCKSIKYLREKLSNFDTNQTMTIVVIVVKASEVTKVITAQIHFSLITVDARILQTAVFINML